MIPNLNRKLPHEFCGNKTKPIMRKKFWLYLEIELTDLLPRFERIFQVDNLYRDYENVWEWIESRDSTGEIYLNISRSHNWENGNYSEPIQIILAHNSKEPIDEDEIGRKLLEEFKTPVFYGELDMNTSKAERYQANIEKTFKVN
ncbi:MAG: hypothetical protein H6574_22875 [Lewinellaceae bacterium]|nr:hypothetical protein [Lewinellaceae bacterium]